MSKDFEYTLWTELIAFENTDPDHGAARYLDSTPIKPDAILLFICAADFPFSHQGMEQEYELAPTVCSRNAHPRNEQRERQKWTNYQLRDLISNLRNLGVPTFLSMFTCTYDDEFGEEWLTKHPELIEGFKGENLRFNPITCLKDGTPCENIFAPKVAQLCRDYGFVGFHGADRFNSTGLLHRRVASDNITWQFLQSTALQAPEYVTCSCNNHPERMKKRMSWIWKQHRVAFTDFIRKRWKSFWKTVADAVHKEGGTCLMNSSFTRGSHGAAAFLGIDYKEMIEAGVDAIVCETTGLGMANQAFKANWDNFPDLQRHYHNWCITAMMEIRAYLPDTKIFFLHACKDVVENVDNIRQSPTGYERELFALSSLCHYRKGKLFRAADGLTACLADGFSESDWKFITDRWKAAIRHEALQSAGEIVFVWDDRMVSEGVEDYYYDLFPSPFDTIYQLKYHGFAIQSTARADELNDIHEPLCVPMAHLLGHEMVDALTRRQEPVILIGRSEFLKKFADKGAFFTDTRFAILILSVECKAMEKVYRPASDLPPYNEGGRNFLEICSFTAIMPRMGITPALIADAFSEIHRTLDAWKKNSGRFYAECKDADGECALLSRTFEDGSMEVIVENLVPRNIPKTLSFSKEIADYRISTSFPLYPNSVSTNSISLRASANRGLCAVCVRPVTENEHRAVTP